MHVCVAQVLCPRRHAIVAAVREVEDDLLAKDPELVQEAIAEEVRRDYESGFTNLPTDAWRQFGMGRFDPWCGICRAPASEWHVEVTITVWTSMEEAMPYLRAGQLLQLASRRYVDEQKANASKN